MACYHDGVRKDDNSRQGRTPNNYEIFRMMIGGVSYTLAPIDYQDSNNTKLVYQRAKL
jgi:hypothetical protein